MFSKKFRNFLLFGCIAAIFAAVGYWNISPERFLDKPPLSAAENPGLVEDTEMLGDVLLRGAEALGQLRDARLAVAETLEDPDPHRLTDDAEAPRDQLDDGRGERIR